MPTGEPTLGEVDAYIASRRRDYRFPRAIEAAFEAQSRAYQASRMRTGILPAILIYNAFLPANYLLVPDTFWLSLILHLAIVTPWIVGVGLVFRQRPRLMVREALAATIPILMVGQILLIYLLNAGASADQYQYLAIMILVYMNVNQRPDFRFALGTSLVLIAMYVGALVLGSSPFPVKLVGTLSMMAAAHLTLVANWRMTRDARHVFLRRLQDRLRREDAEAVANRDELTGLPNRRYLESRAAALWNEADDAASVAVVMIDVDHFKLFNDYQGHLSGDLCLKRVAGVIASDLGEGDIPVRFGGEEFLLLLPRTDCAEAQEVAERIRRGVEDLAVPHEALGPLRCVTASLGVAAGRASAHSLSELMAAADDALYAAKRNGRNQIWPPLSRARSAVVALDSHRTLRSA